MAKINRVLGLMATLGFFALLLAWAVPALAADDDRSEPEFRLDLDPVIYLQLDRDELEFNPTPNELISGRTAPQQLTARVTANTEWVLSVVGTDTVWEGPWGKPVGDILWRLAGSGDYRALSTSSTEVWGGAPAREFAVSLDLAIALEMSRDLPGTYRYESFVFEVSAQ